jgi:hypothetical protein
MPEVPGVLRLLLPGVLLVAAGCAKEPASQAAAPGTLALDVPAADASTGPNLAVAADGRVVLSWVEPAAIGHRLVYAALDGERWSAPSAVSEGTGWFVNWADFPSVVPLHGPLWAAHWLVRQPAGGYAYDILVSQSRDGGATWSAPMKPHDDATPTEHGFVTAFPLGGGAGLVWLDGRETAGPRQAMTLRAARIGPDASIAQATEVDGLVCDCCQTDAVAVPGGAVVVYRDRSDEEIRDISAARLTAGGWQPGRHVADDGWIIDGCPVNGPVVAADGDRVAVAWFTGAGGTPRVRVARSRDAGATFLPPVDVVSGANLGHAGIALLDGDRVAVSWVCELPQKRTGVCLRSVASDGALGRVRIVSGDEDVVPLSVPQLARGGNRLVAAWTSRPGDSTTVSSALLDAELSD